MSKKFRPTIVIGVIKELRKPKVAVKAMATGEDRILFSFNTEVGMRTVLRGRPWFFEEDTDYMEVDDNGKFTWVAGDEGRLGEIKGTRLQVEQGGELMEVVKGPNYL
ncbi:hypothetical protein PS2_032076 [Malus domestica]